MASVPGVVMSDPSDRRRTVWVQEKDRAEFEKRGYLVVPSEEERKAVPKAAPRAASTPEPEPEAEEAPAEPEAPTPEPEPETPKPGVTFPRRAQRKTP